MVTKFPYPKIELQGIGLRLYSGEQHELHIVKDGINLSHSQSMDLGREQVEALAVLLQEWLAEDREIDIKYRAFVEKMSKGLCYCPSDGKKMLHRIECDYWEGPVEDSLLNDEDPPELKPLDIRACDCAQEDENGYIKHSSFCEAYHGT